MLTLLRYLDFYVSYSTYLKYYSINVLILQKKKKIEIKQLFANRVRYQIRIVHRVSTSSKHGDHKNIESEGRRFSTNALIQLSHKYIIIILSVSVCSQ